jgi:SAM-dependent methyltransferase
MDPAAYEEMRRLEDHHWWFEGRRRAVLPLVAQALSGCERPRVLEVGCGTGGNLAALERELPRVRALGLDVDPGALALCAGRGLGASLVRADGTRLPLADGSVDLILALDVIEHFDDEAALLREFRRVLAAGGRLVASVPAYPALWSPHDAFLHHRRRYRSGQLERALERSGLRVRGRRGFNCALLGPIALMRWAKGRLARRSAPSSDFFELPGPLNRALAGYLGLEARAARRLGWRHGLSFLVDAERDPLG